MWRNWMDLAIRNLYVLYTHELVSILIFFSALYKNLDYGH